MTIKFSSAVLFVKDIWISRGFYETMLEQTVELDHGECVVFSGGFSIWEQDYANQVVFGQTSDVPVGAHPGFELYFETGSLDHVCQKLRQASVKEVHPVREQPWGQRVFRVYDPDGYIVEIGEPMEAVIRRFLAAGMTVEEAASRTSMPVEAVRAAQEA